MALPVAVAGANSAIPGPIVLLAGSLFTSSEQWLVVAMTTCVLVEGSIYRYVGTFRRPFLASASANFVSLVAGIPLGIAFSIDPTWFLLATVASIFVEYHFLRAISQYVVAADKRLTGIAQVFWANVVTNLMLVGFVFWASSQPGAQLRRMVWGQ